MTAFAWETGQGTVDAQSKRLGLITQTMQLVTATILAPILFLMCLRLPNQWGWENGPVEMAQNVLLGVGAVCSLFMAYRRQAHAQRWFWLAVALVWLLLLGRELSWGAVFAQPYAVDPVNGPFYTSRVLSYRPLVPVVGTVLVLAVVVLLLLARPAGLVRYAWHRRALLPFGTALAFLAYGVIATLAERGQHGGWAFAGSAQLIEEVFEAGAYYFLLRAQWVTFLRWLRPAGAASRQA